MALWIASFRNSAAVVLRSLNAVTRLIQANRLPHLLLYGPPGTGKTSTVLALAKQLYGPKWKSMTLELNASDERGIDVVREQIKSFAGTRKLFSTGVKLVILDEADAMTSDAQFALRRVIEKYTRTTRFCLLCNYVSKIIPALQSRCTRFRFAPLKVEHIRERFAYVVDKEGLTARLTDTGQAAILRQSGGDMRKVLNVLQACANGYETIDEDAAYSCIGAATPKAIKELTQTLLKRPFKEGYDGACHERCALKAVALHSHGCPAALTYPLLRLIFHSSAYPLSLLSLPHHPLPRPLLCPVQPSLGSRGTASPSLTC